MTTEITIKIENECISVWKDGATTGQVTLGEMLEQVVSLVHEANRGCSLIKRYPMDTPEGWENRKSKWREKTALQAPVTE